MFGNLYAWYISPNRFLKSVCAFCHEYLPDKSPEWIWAHVCVFVWIACRLASFLPPSFYLGRLKPRGNASAHRLQKASSKVGPLFAVTKRNRRTQSKLHQGRSWYRCLSRCEERCGKETGIVLGYTRKIHIALFLLCSSSGGGISQETSVLCLTTCAPYAPDSCVEIRLYFLWRSLCSWELAFLLTVLKLFQGCMPNKHALFGAGTGYG